MVVSSEAVGYKAIVAVLAREFEPLTGPVAVSIDVYRPAKRRDLDNCLKVVLDALQGHLYVNDDQIVEIQAHRFEGNKHTARVEVAVWEVRS
jgi:crossover junction endodeoxyribonuclease RusA